jgi:uncharacterized protein YlxW (UPF0749 family)
MSPEIAVPLMVFGLPVVIVFVTRYFNFREKQLAAQTAAQKLLPEAGDSQAKQRELEARIENLASILIALESEREPRLDEKRAASRLQAAARPAIASSSTVAAPQKTTPNDPADDPSSGTS